MKMQLGFAISCWMVLSFLPGTTVVLQAQILTFTDEAAYLNTLATVGYATLEEGFEDDGVWGGVRSTLGSPASATSVTTQGVVWTANHPGNSITTSSGAARSGDWGVYDPDHGLATGSAMECDVEAPPAECFFHDGVSGSRVVDELPFSGVGGWFSGTAGAKVAVILDQATQVELGKLGSSQQFLGIIDTNGFNSFEIREIEGRIGDQLFLFADDFTFGLRSSLISCIPTDLEDTTCDGQDDDCNGLVDDGYLSDDSCGTGICLLNNTPSSCTDGVETTCRPGTPHPEDSALTCKDNLDNNCNGLIDGADPGCGGTVEAAFSWLQILPVIISSPE